MEKTTTIRIVPDGPAIIKSFNTIDVESKGHTLRFGANEGTEITVAICRCGKSKAGGLCDGSHIKNIG